MYSPGAFFSLVVVSLTTLGGAMPPPSQSQVPGNHKFRGDYFYNAKTNAFIKLHEDPATWEDARNICRYEASTFVSMARNLLPQNPSVSVHLWCIGYEPRDRQNFDKGARLHTPLNRHQIEAVKNLMTRSFNTESLFTGLGRFSNGQFFDVDMDLPGFRNRNAVCKTFQYNGSIANERCDIKKRFVCYKFHLNDRLRACGTSDPEYKLYNSTSKCYKFHKTPKTWYEAKYICDAERSRLAIVKNEAESRAISHLFNTYSPESISSQSFLENVTFIGFSYNYTANRYETLDGISLKEAGFDTFAPAQPSEGLHPALAAPMCGGIFRSGLLDDITCANKQSFICEREAGFRCSCCN